MSRSDQNARRDKYRQAKNVAVAAQESFKSMKFMREKRRDLEKLYEGAYRRDERETAPLNLIARHTDAMLANLAGSDAEVEIDPTTDPALQGVADITKIKLEHELRRMRYRDTAEACILNALMGVGIAKVGLSPSPEAAADAESWTHDPGQRYIDCVDPDAYVVDMTARNRLEIRYEGHGYDALPDDLVESGIIKRAELDRLPRTKDHRDKNTSSSPRFAGDREAAFAAGDYVTLQDFWVARGVVGREEMIITVPGIENGSTIEPRILRMHEYEGPERGPYCVLGFKPHPRSALPAAPLAYYDMLAALTNGLLRHIIDLETKRKEFFGASDETTEQIAAAFAAAQNGHIIKIPRGQLERITVPGASAESYTAMNMMKGLFSEGAMSADTLSGNVAGRGSDPSATAVAAANQRLGIIIGAMEEKYYAFCDDVLTKLFWYFRTDPTLDEIVHVQVTDGVTIPIPLTAEVFRKLDPSGLSFRVTRGSMRRVDNDQRVERAVATAAQVLPLIANAAQLMPDFDAKAAMELMLRRNFKPAEIATLWRSQSGQVGTGSAPAPQRTMMAQPGPMPGAAGAPQPMAVGGV